MKSSAFYALIGIGVLIILGIIWFGFYHTPVTATASPVVTTTPHPTSLTGLSIYTNGEYGFSIFYPGKDKTETTFDSQYHLPNTWRVNAVASGTPIFAIIGTSIQSTTSYPRYFETEVRIGASTDPKEVAACESPSNGETALPDKVINGVAWKVFTLQDAGMMQYLNGTSYRTIHDKTCYALEEIETGSSYRDDASSTSDISDAVLNQDYADLSSIVQSFSFSRK